MAKRKKYNPEKRAWRGRSYKNGKRVVELKAGDECTHGKFWYAETESENPDHPVGSLSIDCTQCKP